MHVGKRQKVIFTFSLDDSSKHDFQSLSNSVFSIQSNNVSLMPVSCNSGKNSSTYQQKSSSYPQQFTSASLYLVRNELHWLIVSYQTSIFTNRCGHSAYCHRSHIKQWTVDSLHMDGSHSCLSYSDHCRIMNLNWEGYENEILHTAY